MNLISSKEINKENKPLKTKKFLKEIKSADENKYSNAKFLKNIKLKDGIEIIGEYAFYYCKNLKTVELPDSVREIKDDAFAFCTKLEEIVLPEELEYIGSGAFYDCQSLKKIIIPKNIKKIMDSTFEDCKNLEEVILPEGLEYIGSEAFFCCEKLKRIVIPQSIKTIGTEVFANCSDNLEIYDQVTNMRFINDINYNYDKDKSIDEIIIDLCSKYDIVKEKLLFLARLRLWTDYYEKLNYDDEYNSFINYCKNNLFASLQKHNSIPKKTIDTNSISGEKNSFVPWYLMGQSNLIYKNEYDKIEKDDHDFNSELITDDDLLLLEKLGIKKDEFGYWYNGDIISELKVEDMKKLVKINNYSNLSKKNRF